MFALRTLKSKERIEHLEISLVQMKSELIQEAISLEQECGLSSRSGESYLKLLQDSKSILIAAASQAGNVVAIFTGWVVADELEIDNIAVSKSARQQGIATKLLTEAIETAKQKGVVRAVLEVRSNNTPACSLYEKFGFTAVGRRKSYYQNPLDDALIMAFEIHQKIPSDSHNQS